MKECGKDMLIRFRSRHDLTSSFCFSHKLNIFKRGNMKKILISIITSLFTLGFAYSTFADGHKVYGPYPITLKGYDGDKTNSVKYTGQMARQVLHDSLKALVKSGDVAKMMAYYNGEDNLEIIAPKSKDDFKIKQTMVSEIGSGNLSGKTYKGAVAGWGNLTGPRSIRAHDEQSWRS